jgi:hypothetical protein
MRHLSFIFDYKINSTNIDVVKPGISNSLPT